MDHARFQIGKVEPGQGRGQREIGNADDVGAPDRSAHAIELAFRDGQNAAVLRRNLIGLREDARSQRTRGQRASQQRAPGQDRRQVRAPSATSASPSTRMTVHSSIGRAPSDL